MRILVVGAGRTGAHVLRQLQKNPELTLITLDPVTDPYAVQEGIIEAVDHREALTPFTLDYVLQQTRPDLVLLTTTTGDLGLGRAPGMDLFAEALQEELVAIASVPIIIVARQAP